MKSFGLLLLFIVVGFFGQVDIVNADGTIPSSDGTILGCYKTHINSLEKQGSVRLVSDQSSCKNNETPVAWNAGTFVVDEALCDIEIRMKLTLPDFPIRQECIPPAPEAPVLTELIIQTDNVTASLQVAGNATPNTILVPYVGDDCQQSLSEFFSDRGVTGDFDILIGADPDFDVEFSLPPTVVPYIGVIPSLAPFWTAKSIDALDQISECSVDAIGIVVDNL
jgi:hypothetical protein